MKLLPIITALALAGCAHTVQDRPVTVKVPVAQPCANPRPTPPVALKDKTPDWSSLDVRQKAALVGKQGLEWQSYGEALNAATGACPAVH